MKQKPLLPILVFLILTDFTVSASDRVAVERAADFTVWESLSSEIGPDGDITQHPNRIVQLETGLNYLNSLGQWEETVPNFEITENGGEVKRGRHKVLLSANIADPAPMKLTTSENKVLKSRILCLAYFDPITGRSELVAELTDSIGAIHNGNQVIYPNAFTDIEADVRYTYTRAGFEQDIILRQQPPAPEVYGFDPQTAQLEVWTEFIDPPIPDEEQQVQQSTNAIVRTFVGPNLTDRGVGFGKMKISRGKAFTIDRPNEAFPVGKTWQESGGRTFLIEAVNINQIAPAIQNLPAAAEPRAQSKRTTPKKYLAQSLPERVSQGGEMLVALNTPTKPGFVLDYLILNSTTNQTFASDTTYHVTGAVLLAGRTSLEGGAIIKYSATNNAQITVQGSIECLTSQYSPAVFTSVDDNTVGQSITGSSGQPSGTYAAVALLIDGTPSDLKHLRFRNVLNAVSYSSASGHPHTIAHAQFLNCAEALISSSPVLRVRNALFTNVATVFSAGATGIVATAEHLTVHKANALNASTNLTLSLLNSLLVEITSLGNYSGASNQVVSTNSGVFESVGAGHYYLASSSPYRGIGSTNINERLKGDFESMTTYAPTVLASQIVTQNLVLSATVLRDTGVPDLGYHYPVLDFLVGDISVTNATVLLTNRVAVGTFSQNSGESAFTLSDGGSLISEGEPIFMNQIVRASTVQEALKWSDQTGPAIKVNSGTYLISPYVSCRFTGFSVFGNTLPHYTGTAGTSASFYDCQFGRGTITAVDDIIIENCVFDRVNQSILVGSGSVHEVLQNLFYGGEMVFHESDGQITVRDNILDGTTVSHGSNVVAHSHNAYRTSVSFGGTTSSNVIVSSFIYEGGPLGRFYRASNSPLTNKASRTAPEAGLYHYTTRGDQEKKGTNRADIGFHYVSIQPALREIPKNTMSASGTSTGFGWEYSYALDGLAADPGWHNNNNVENPSFLRVDLGISKILSRVDYIPREGAANEFTGGPSNGSYRKYRLFVTDDSSDEPGNWGAEVANGQWHWPSGQERRTLDFQSKSGRYIVFRRDTASGSGSPPGYANVNELWAYERLDGVNRQLDYDVDGIGDYLEDVNGNGIYDSGESDWLNPPTVGQQYSPDTNGVINLRIFTPFN